MTHPKESLSSVEQVVTQRGMLAMQNRYLSKVARIFFINRHEPISDQIDRKGEV